VKCVCSGSPAFSSYEGYTGCVAGTENTQHTLRQPSRREESNTARPFSNYSQCLTRTALWLSEADIMKFEYLKQILKSSTCFIAAHACLLCVL